MRALHRPIAAVSIACAVVAGAQPARADPSMRSAAFDGTWFVSLECPDTTDRSGLVKGYQFAFDVQIADGRLDGRHGVEGMAPSLHLTGEVREGGALEIRAQGLSGSNEFVVGRAARGTPYGYTMTGRIDGDRGEAARREVRPCTALLTRKGPVAR